MVATTTRTRKAKGRNFQNHVAERIKESFDFTSRDVKPAIMGETGVDIHLSEKAFKNFPFAIECKNTEKASVWQWIKQAETHGEGKPLVVFKRNRSKAYAIISFEDLLQLCQR